MQADEFPVDSEFDENKSGMRFHFSPAKEEQKELIHKWLEQEYIREWIHGKGLQNTLNGLEKFFQGIASWTYWVGYDNEFPFAFLITSPEGTDAITLDVFICDRNYLGKGLAVPMIRSFLFSQFPHVKRVLIDPEASNKRAIHVYEKVGFKIIGEFIASWHPVPHYQMVLEMESLQNKTKKLDVVDYNPEWPKMFEREALKIQEALGSNCLAIHHVGSTSVPGLFAKPKIDILAVVKNPAETIEKLEAIGFVFRGEYNIPMHDGFSKRGPVNVNLHLYPERHPEIELNLTFRDYLRNHPEVRDAYAALKKNLLKEKSSYEKKNSIFSGYALGKDAFIRSVLKKTHFNRIRIMKCTHYAEWDAAKRFRQTYFFDPLSIADPYTWTFDHQDHAHLILYLGNEIIGYAHLQFWPDQRATLRILVIDETYRHQGFGSQFLHLCEQWLKKQGIRSLHSEARSSALRFYQKNGYTEMPFNDPSGALPSAQDVAMGKIL